MKDWLDFDEFQLHTDTHMHIEHILTYADMCAAHTQTFSSFLYSPELLFFLLIDRRPVENKAEKIAHTKITFRLK